MLAMLLDEADVRYALPMCPFPTRRPGKCSCACMHAASAAPICTWSMAISLIPSFRSFPVMRSSAPFKHSALG